MFAELDKRVPNVIILQPSVPTYRVDFFDRLESHLGEKLAVYSSPGKLGTLSDKNGFQKWEKSVGRIVNLMPGIDWQRGVLGIQINKTDVVVVSGTPRCITNILFLIKARLVGAKTVWWGQYWSSTSKNWRFELRLMLMRLSTVLLFYTDKEIAEFDSKVGKHNFTGIYSLNNGIDVTPIKRLRMPYTSTGRERLLFFVGRLTEKAGLSVLIEAMSFPEMSGVCLHIIGDGPERGNLQAQAQELEVAERITLQPGTTDEQTIAEAANRARLFVYPGGVGLSLLHAMAYGLPAVLHDNRWKHMPEIAAFGDGQTGCSFAFGDAHALAVAIASCIDETETLDTWSANSIPVAEIEYNTEQMAKRFITMLSQF